MTNDRINISRRKVLAGLGMIGVASAGAGLGTSAFFSDREDFTDNSIVAGTLDMKVDWEEHYYWGEAGRDLVEYVPVGEANYVLPAPLDNPDARPISLKFVGDGTPQDLKDALWDATAIEAFPDYNDDGLQDGFEAPCETLADVPADLSSSARTASSIGEPLISLDDVKPGDFGEVTFSFHLCDNPGYVWMNGRLVDAQENGLTEPESKDPDEEEGVVELLDEVLVRMWYDDDGDNQLDIGDVDIMLAIDVSGSIQGDERTALIDGVDAFVNAVNLLPNDGTIQIGSLEFANEVKNVQELSDPASFDANVTIGDFGGRTVMPAALDIASQMLHNEGRPSAEKIIVLIGDGGPNYLNQVYSAGYDGTTYEGPRDATWSDDGTDQEYDLGSLSNDADVTTGEQDETAMVAEMVRDEFTRIAVVNVGDDPNADLLGGRPLNDYLRDEIASPGRYFELDIFNLADVSVSLAADVLVGEEVFFQGTLRQALATLAGNDGRGVPLDGDRTTPCDELGDPENSPDRDPFDGGGKTYYVGFQWWLPVDHANQVQSDSVEFDLGFYTEQARHNDGSGQSLPVETQLIS